MMPSTTNGATSLPIQSCWRLWSRSACWVFGVRYSRGVKWLVLAVLLALTLGLKLAVRPVSLGDSPDKDAQRRVVDFLTRQRFVVLAAERVEEGRPMVRASAGACHLLIAKSPAM